MTEAKEKQYALRLPPDLYQEVEQWAAGEMRSVNAQIVTILRDAVAQRKLAQKRAKRETEEDALMPGLVAA